MYSLLVTHLAADHCAGPLELPKVRFLEYTAELIVSQLRSLSEDAKQCLSSWPCILMQEGRGQEQAFLGRVELRGVTDSEIKIRFVSIVDSLTNDALWKMRGALDIEQFEFSRNHWAIKDRDLFAELDAAGHVIDRLVSRTFPATPLPAPPRSDLFRARDVIGGWSHSTIDDLLLEVGVAELRAGREIGGRRARANAIVRFAIDKPGATTAENLLLGAFIVKKACLPPAQSGASEAERPAVDEVQFASEGRLQTGGRVPSRVFVVHGRDSDAKDRMVEYLRGVGLEPIVLNEQPSMGRHLLTKFIDEANLVTFAVVLMTDDDMGGLKDGPSAPRARQNVILELGYFLAHLGQSRVCALVTPELETPSDFDGIVFIPMDAGGKWKAELRRELVAAEMPLSVTEARA